ncbi:helix-turn-helix domain-containing protein [Roseibium salinum]|nr:helix-turn-helix domain-containing protein [Roseibium salinum]
MQVFWKHGYAATSLDQICAATNLNRPSLYAAFGGKKRTYISRWSNVSQIRCKAVCAKPDEPRRAPKAA